MLGPVAALVAAWQSSEALKIMVGKKDAASPHLVHVDLWENDFSTLPMTRVAGCAVCGQHKFDLLEHGSRLATASLCGRDAVQIVPPPSSNLDFDLLRQTLGRIFTLEQNPYLLKFRADDHDMVVFPDGRAMVFGTFGSERGTEPLRQIHRRLTPIRPALAGAPVVWSTEF